MANDAPRAEPLSYSPDSAAHRLGCSTRAIYRLIATNELRSFKIGKRRLIPDTELQSFTQRQLKAAA